MVSFFPHCSKLGRNRFKCAAINFDHMEFLYPERIISKYTFIEKWNSIRFKNFEECLTTISYDPFLMKLAFQCE